MSCQFVPKALAEGPPPGSLTQGAQGGATLQRFQTDEFGEARGKGTLTMIVVLVINSVLFSNKEAAGNGSLPITFNGSVYNLF